MDAARLELLPLKLLYSFRRKGLMRTQDIVSVVAAAPLFPLYVYYFKRLNYL